MKRPVKGGPSPNPAGRPKKLPELDKLLADVLGYNWLLQVAFESVQVGQLSTDSTPTMAFADPEE